MRNKLPIKEKTTPLEVIHLNNLTDSLVIGPSHMMSLYCYSILRLDPYKGCMHKCLYCYTKYFPNTQSIRIIANYPKLLSKFFSKFLKKNLKLPPFRLSTLTDPFQPIEERFKLSYRILNLCLNNKIHVIISTKSNLLIKEPWLSIIKKLTERKLTIVQFTITSFGKIAKYLEPKAPSPEERLKAIEVLSDENIPVALRLQPIIPYVNDSIEFLEEYVKTARAYNVKLIITEAYRFLSWSELKIFNKILNNVNFKKLINRELWEYYPNSYLKRPKIMWRRKVYSTLRDLCLKNKIGFSVCRDELYYLRTTPDCCGIFLMQNYILKKTINEYLHEPSAPVLEKEYIQKYPFASFRRKLLKHYEKLESYIAHKPL